MAGRYLLRGLILLAVAVVLGGLGYVYVKPPENLRRDRDGVPYFTPPVVNPVNGEAVPMKDLVRNYTKGRQ